MTIDKKALFSFLFGLDVLANILELTHVNFLYTTTLISFCAYILLPGILIAFILRIPKISFWENLLFVGGLSVAFLEFGGLLLNILLPLVGIQTPLTFHNLIIGFDIFMLLLFVFAWIRTKPFTSQIQLPSLSYTEQILYVLPVYFPVVAALGAVVLNNGGSNILTFMLLGFIAGYSLLLVALHNKIAIALYPCALFFIGLALLFTTSLRSWYITGHDVEREFYVFQLTNTHHVWNMAFYQDAYNACLSITILPTVLTNLLALQDMYVYKVIFQILFALTPVMVFFIINNYATPVLAFLSAFFYISFPTFFNDMPMLNRQEIGFIFFGLALYMMVKRNWTRQFYTRDRLLFVELSLPKRKILFAIFVLSVVVSHYSTNFMDVALLTFVYVSTRILSLSFVKNTLKRLVAKTHLPLKNTFPNKAFLSLPLLLLLFGATYFWNNIYTKSSNHAGSVVTEVVSSLLLKSGSDAKSSDLSYSIFFSSKPDPKQQLQEYIQSIVKTAQTDQVGDGKTDQFYSSSITSKYPSYPINQEQLAPTPLGNLLNAMHVPVFGIQAELRSLSAMFMQLFVFIGLLAIFFFKQKKMFDVQYLLFCCGAILMLILEILLPALSVEYGLLRMFLQFLFIFSLPIVLSIQTIFFFIKEEKRVFLTGIVAIVFFLTLTGFISHLTGKYYPQMTLDNAGLYYDAYYVHKSDVLAINWLAHNDAKHEPVQADLSGTNKLLTYGGINALNEIFPPVIRKNAYVYQEIATNTVVSIDANVLIYNSSKPFLDNNKDLMYSNGQVNVYR
jgi:uncharacterized membrane protein